MVEQVQDGLNMASLRSAGITSSNRVASRPLLATVSGFYVLAVAAPLLAAVALSFSAFDTPSAYLASVDGYRAVFAGGRLGELAHLAGRALTVTVITCLIGVPAGFWLRQRQSGVWSILLLAAFIAPWLVSDMLRAFGWQLLLSPDGPVSWMWQAIGGEGPLEGLRYNRVAVVVGLVSATLPACIISVFAALPAADSPEWMAARELGAPRHVLSLMAGGRARAGVIFGACAVFLFSLFGSAEARFLDGPTQTSMQTIAASLANTGVAALLAWGVVLFALALAVCAAFAMLFLIWHRWPDRRRHKLGERPGGRLGALAGQLLDATAQAAPPTAVLVSLLLCCAPVAMVVAEAFREPSANGAVWGARSFVLLLASPDLVAALLRSALLALAVAALAVASGFMLSLSVWNSRLLRIVLGILIALVLLPAEVYAISAIQVAKVFGLTQANVALLLLSHLVWTAPFAVTGLILANRAIPESVIEAALEYGRRPVSVAFGTVASINRAALFGAGLLAFCLSLNESTRTTYLGGALPSLGNQVYGRLQAGLLPENRAIFAIETLLIAIALGAAMLVVVALQRGPRPQA